MVAVLCEQHKAKTTAPPAVYRRRQPERSPVYQVVQGQLETWLSGCRNRAGRVPRLPRTSNRIFANISSAGFWHRQLCSGKVRRLRLRFPHRLLMKYIPVFHSSSRCAVQIRSGRICHCCIIDGLFSSESEGVRFDEAAINAEAIAKVQAQLRERVLRLFRRRGLFSPEAVDAMRSWGHEGGLSLNADGTLARDRAGLERLLRYCARPVFASERLQWIETDQRLVYRLPKQKPDGQTVLYLTPLEFLDKLAVLIPPPRKHRHRYCPAFWHQMHRYAKQ